MVRGLFVVFFAFFFVLTTGTVGAAVKLFNPALFHTVTGSIFATKQEAATAQQLSQAENRSRVLGESIANPLLQFNVPTTFTEFITTTAITVTGETALEGPVRADTTLNVTGISTFNDNVIIEGDLLLNRGLKAEGTTVDVGNGKVLGSNLLYKATAGGGIAVTGTQEFTIENTDKGSDQKIFKSIKVGDTTFSAGSNTDTVTVAAGAGISVGIDTTNKKLTISATSADATADIDALETTIGSRDYTNGLALTDAETLTASLEKINVAIGSRSYTGANYLTSSQTLTASLVALDTAITSAGSHDAITLAGSYDYLTLSGQQITLGQIDLTTDVTGVLPITNGGTGANTLSNLITLATHTTGNYVATIADSGSSLISVTGSGSENAAVTLSIAADGLDFSEFKDQLALDASTDIAIDGTEVFSLTNTGSGSSFLVNDEASDTTPFQISSDGNVGIGTTAPGIKLDVNGSIRGSNYYFPGTPERIWASGGVYMTVTGNKIFGFTGSQLALPATTSLGFVATDDGSGSGIDVALARDAANILALKRSTNSQEFRIYNSDSTADEFASIGFINNSNVFSIETEQASGGTVRPIALLGGNVGVGTTNPTAGFHYKTAAAIGAGISFETSDVKMDHAGNLPYNRIYGTGSSGNMFINGGSGYIDISQVETSRVRINSSGNVGIGTTSPTGLFHVEGGPVGKALVALNQTGNQDILTASVSGTTKLSINNSGNFAIPNRTFEFATDWTDSPGVSSDMFSIRRTTSTINQGGSSLFAVKNNSTTWFSLTHDGVILRDGQGATNITTTGGVSWEAGSGDFVLTTSSGWEAFRAVAAGGGTGHRTLLRGSTSGFDLTTVSGSSTGVRSLAGASTLVGFTVMGASSQTANLQEWQNSSASPLSVINSAGNLGIGTSAPVSMLHVTGGSVGKALAVFNQTGDQAILTASASGTTRFIVTNDGNVGIGTTAPSSLLNLSYNNTSTDVSALKINSSNASGQSVLGFYVNNTLKAKIRGDYDGNLGFESSGTGSIDYNYSGGTGDVRFWNGSGTNLVTFKNAGNVGIGTTSPAGKLDVTDTSNTAASLTLTNNTATTIGAGANTVGVIDLQSTSLTTGNFLNMEVNALTSGKGINLTSTSTALTSGSLTNLYWNPASATTATGDLFKIDIGANGLLTGNLFALYNNGSSIFRVATAQINSDVPHSFNAAGDVSVAYDLVFTNQTASTINSLGPLTISAGEAFENNDLNLLAYGTGKINLINSGLGMQTSEKLIFDTDDAGDSYFAHNNSGNYLSIFADNTEAARFKSDGAVDGNTTFNANAFDLAEYYPTKDTTVEAGDVVSIAPKNESDAAATDSPYLVEKSSPDSVGQVIGVVSTKPGFALGGGSFRSEMCTEVLQGSEEDVRQKLIERELGIMSSDTTTTASSNVAGSASSSAQLTSNSAASNSSKLKYSKTDLSDAQLSTIEDKIQTCKAISSVPIALAGRVPVKVDPALAKQIKAGDLLTASTTKAGTAKKATEAGWVLGRALEDYTEGNDTVMTFVFVSYYNGGSTNSLTSVKPNGNPVVLSDEVGDVLGMMADSSNNVYLVSYASFNVTGDIAAANITASSQIIAGNLTIDSTDNSITSIADSILKLQTDVNAGAVDIFNGKIIFNTDGEIITLSDIQAKMIGAEKFMIKKTQDSSGKDTSSVGLATLKAGTKELQVSNPNVTISSKIFVTPRSSTKGQTLFVSSVEQEKFTVSVDTALTSDVLFDYWILGVQ
jgi:hypothetical protein